MIRWASKVVHGWNGHLETFCQVNRYFTENSRWMSRIVKNNNRSNRSTLFRYISLPLICMTTTWNVQKLPLHVLWRKCGTCSCSLFPLPLISFSSAIRFVSVRCSLGKLDLFKNYKGFNIIFPIDWPRSNSTIPPIASAALLRERGR